MSKDWINQSRKNIHNYLDGYFPENKGRIQDAVRHSVVNQKAHLWRPLMAIASGKAYDFDSEKILPYALTPELVHTASLMLDDLPSMDDADVRRGKPSCHKQFDIATTELGFYYLIEKARTIIQDGNLPNKTKIELLKASTDTSFKLIEGQKRDLYGVASDKKRLFDEVISLYQQKTGAMFAYSALIGGIIGNASETELEKLSDIGKNVGVAYQIRDDILDVCGNEEEIGKPTNQDENKTTIIDLIGLDKSKKLIKDYRNKINEGLSCLKNCNRDVSYLENLVEKMLEI